MRRIFEVYGALFKVSTAVQLQYRASMVIWLISTVLQPVVYLVVWSNVAESRGGSAGGFTTTDFAAYFIVLMIVDHLTFDWHMWEYDYRIREGLLSPLLLRPLHPIHADIADNIAYKLLSLLVMVPAAVALTFLFRPALDPPLWALLAALPAVLLAAAVRFLTSWAVAMAAFWTTRIDAINNIYFVTELFFSGRLAPLALLPAPLPFIATLLPFRWALAFPVELVMGRLTPRETIMGLLAQLIWVGLSLVLLRLVWHAGVRRYAAFGA